MEVNDGGDAIDIRRLAAGGQAQLAHQQRLGLAGAAEGGQGVGKIDGRVAAGIVVLLHKAQLGQLPQRRAAALGKAGGHQVTVRIELL